MNYILKILIMLILLTLTIACTHRPQSHNVTEGWICAELNNSKCLCYKTYTCFIAECKDLTDEFYTIRRIK